MDVSRILPCCVEDVGVSSKYPGFVTVNVFLEPSGTQFERFVGGGACAVISVLIDFSVGL